MNHNLDGVRLVVRHYALAVTLLLIAVTAWVWLVFSWRHGLGVGLGLGGFCLIIFHHSSKASVKDKRWSELSAEDRAGFCYTLCGLVMTAGGYALSLPGMF